MFADVYFARVFFPGRYFPPVSSGSAPTENRFGRITVIVEGQRYAPTTDEDDLCEPKPDSIAAALVMVRSRRIQNTEDEDVLLLLG